MRNVFTAVLAAILLCGHAMAAAPVRRIYVFGDSYSDTGRGFVDGNGPTAVAYLAQRLGLEMVASNAPDATRKSLNFAVSGAPTGSSAGQPLPGGGWLGLGMKEEVQEFVGMVKSGKVKFDPAITLFFIAGGLNDGRFPTAETVANLEDEMQTLYSVGARRFAVAILPEKIPGFDKTAIRLNPALAGIPAEMRPKLAGAVIETSHWGAFFDEVMEHPAKYGITDTTHPCATGRTIFNQDATPCANPADHFYYNPSHPSTATHKAVGDMLFGEVKGW
jgi:phospholipase/lecithinase/hemolysin